MPVKPVITIDVDSSKFDAFYRLFQEYSDDVDKMPEAWRSLDEAMGGSTETLKAGALDAKDALAIAAAQAGVISEALKDATKAQGELGHATIASAKSMGSLAKAAQGVGEAISFVGGWILKLGAFAGLGALFSGFGIGELANTAFTRFRSASQLGLSPGQLASFQVNAQQFLDTSVLESLANARIDLTKLPAFALLGINAQRAATTSTPNLAFDTLRSAALAYRQDLAHGRYPAQDPRLFYAAAQLGLTMDEVRNAAMNLDQLTRNQANYNREIAALEIPKQQAQEWADLKVTLDRAGMTIETALIDKLAPLAPQITILAGDIAGFIKTFINSKNFDTIVNDVRIGLQKFGVWLTGPEPGKLWAAAQKLGDEIVVIADKLGWLLPQHGKGPPNQALNQDIVLGGLFGPFGALLGASVNEGGPFASWLSQLFGINTKDQQRSIRTITQEAKRYGVNPALALAIARQESGFHASEHYMDHYASGAPAGYSTGLFGLNQYGEGAGYSLKALLNPKINADIFMAHMVNVLREPAQEVLAKFSTLARADAVLTHAQIMALAGTPGEYAAVEQRPAHAYQYALGINRQLKSMYAKTHRATKPPVHVSITNSTSAHIAVSVNALANA